MDLSIITEQDPPLPAVIRVETLLSRNPVHRLSNRGRANIEVRDKETGKITWRVSHNSLFGEPGPLAYKIETLVINRRIDEARRPDVPEIIRLGSMRDIAELCGIRPDTNIIKKALYQNASAFIDAYLSHGNHFLEISGSRFTVIITGEHFPDGRKADAVYIVLTSWYRDVLNRVPNRPLDYDYLKILPPASQRFYELVSFQIFAALKHKRLRARMLYSDFCMLAPQTRYFQYKRMHRQMNDVHAPHLESSYLQAVEFQETTDRDGNIDWEMLYTPGRKAKQEHGAATKRIPSPRTQRQLSMLLPAAAPPVRTPVVVAPPLDPETLDLIELLVAQGLGKNAAEQFAKDKPEECRRQLGYLPYVGELKSTKGAFLRRAVAEGYGAPKGYAEAKAAEAARAKIEAKARTEKARQSHEEAYQGAYEEYLETECLAELQTAAPERYSAFSMDEQKDREWLTRGPFSKMQHSIKALAVFDQSGERGKRFRRYTEKQAQDKNPLPGILAFWAWDTQFNPEGFDR